MSESVVEKLVPIVDALVIESPTTFTFGGRRFDVQSPPFPRVPGNESVALSPLVDMLQQVLYAYAYAQAFEPGSGLADLTQEPGEDLSGALSEANTSLDRWDHGWRIGQLTRSGQVMASKHGATRTLWPGEFLTLDGPGSPPRVGAVISVYSARHSTTMQPGFYFAFGQTVSEPQEIQDMVRYYWSIRCEGAAELVREATRRLNRFQTPFRLKCCCHRNLFSRLDSAVLYVNRRHWRIAAELIVEIYEAVRQFLGPGSPLFTRRLAPGLAFSEDPGPSESYGTFCCRLLAEGLWTAAMAGEQGREGRLRAVAARFESNGVSLQKPYLRIGSVDLYEFPSYV